MLKKPAGTSNKEGVPNVADAAVVVVTFATLMATVPLEIVTFCSVKFPTVDDEPPSATLVFPSVTDVFDKKLLGKVAATDVILAFCSVKFPTVAVVLPSVIVALPSVAVLLANPVLGITALICEGAILIVAFDAALRRPCASTVKDPTVLAFP